MRTFSYWCAVSADKPRDLSIRAKRRCDVVEMLRDSNYREQADGTWIMSWRQPWEYAEHSITLSTPIKFDIQYVDLMDLVNLCIAYEEYAVTSKGESK